MVDRLLQDLRQAVRRLWKAPGFTLVTVLTLGLGIGATTTLYSVVHGVLLEPLPYPHAERIVRVFEVDDDGTRPAGMADPNFTDLAQQNRSFAAMAQYQTSVVSVSGGREPARVTAAQVSRGFFRVLGVQPVLGRTFDPAEQRVGASPVALVSHGYWQRYLGGGTDLSAHTLRYGDSVVPVIGVLPPGFDFPEGADLWIPRELEPLNTSRTALNKKAIARLDAGVPLPHARRELSGIARRIASRYGDDVWMTDAALVPLRETVVGATRLPLLLLLGASGLLLLIACANVVNLLLARAALQQRDVAVRMALGAGRGRVTRLCLAESLVLCLLGGVLAVLIARWGIGLLRGFDAGRLPRLEEIGVDGTVLLFSLALSVAVAFGLALLAAWRATRGDVGTVLAAGRRTQAGAGGSRLRGGLVVAQVALTLVLLVATALLLRSFQHALRVDPGYRTEGALVLNCHLPYPDTAEQARRQGRFHERLLARLRALPGVAEVGGINALPLTRRGASGTFLLLERPDEVTDFESFETVMKIPGRTGYAEYRRATAGYFRAMGIPLLRGRMFDERDRADAPHAALVSESLAASTWPGEDPVGKLVQFGNMDGDLRPFTVVGVVGDVRENGPEAEPEPTLYARSQQRARALTGSYDIVVVPRGTPRAWADEVRGVVRELDPQAAPSIRTLDELFARSLAERRFQLLLLGVFGATALALALVGVFGVTAFHVARRTREMGVRIALGATGGDVVRLVVRQGLLLVVPGVVLGLAGALAAARLLRSLLFGVAATDPLTFLAVPLLLTAAATLACFLPARHAARVDPVVALRAE